MRQLAVVSWMILLALGMAQHVPPHPAPHPAPRPSPYRPSPYRPSPYRPYSPSPSYGGGGAFKGGTSVITFAVILAVVVVLAVLWAQYRANNVAGARNVDIQTPLSPVHSMQIPESQAFVEAGSSSLPNSFSTGVWRGYYHQFGERHMLCDFSLHFHSARLIEGNGADDVGSYTISGISGKGRIAFQKKYMLHSRTASGHVNTETNKGQCVEYRGQMTGTSIAQGIRGNWYIHHGTFFGTGTFHLWPAMTDWQQSIMTQQALSEPMAAVEHLSTPSAPPASIVFRVTNDNICVVCFERAIDACLRPCCHVAVCQHCARSLLPKVCPICRESIVEITGCAGNRLDMPEGSRPLLAA